MKADLVYEMVNYFSGDARRINHFLKVHAFARAIAEREGLEEKKREIIEVAALVHDIGIKISEEKYGSSAARYQELEGPEEAERLLGKAGYPEDFISRVSFIVGHHHSYQMIDDIDFQIVVEADFLVNIYEDQISAEKIRKIEERYFKTDAGKEFLESIYLKTI